MTAVVASACLLIVVYAPIGPLEQQWSCLGTLERGTGEKVSNGVNSNARLRRVIKSITHVPTALAGLGFPAYQPINPLRIDGPAGEPGGACGSAA